jgi:NADH-quinone oxidoreductase subunit H
MFNFLSFDFFFNFKLVSAIVWSFWVIAVFVLLSTALLTLLERKVMASVQRRRGPNVVGFFGLLQPFADGLKLALKETNVPFRASKILFIVGPVLAFFLAVAGWAFLPFPLFLKSKIFVDFEIAGVVDVPFTIKTFFLLTPGSSVLDFDLSLMFVFVITSLHVYAVLIGGWASNSRYALLGALRSTAQSISYELTMGFIILVVGLLNESLHLSTIVFSQYTVWNVFSLFPAFIVFLVCSLAELNRTPFDLVEAEGELVAGYNVEYSAMMFALYFLGEYISIIFSCFVTAVLFFGGWLLPSFFPSVVFSLLPKLFVYTFVSNSFLFNLFWFTISVLVLVFKVVLLILLSLLIRFVLPRYRYDQLMYIGWTAFLPFCLALLVFVAVIFLYF